LLVDIPVEARVGVGVVDDLAHAAVVDGAGDAEIVEQPDLPRAEPGRDVGVELAGLVVVEEDRALVGADLLHGRLQDDVDGCVERVECRDAAGERDDELKLAQLLELLGVGCRVAHALVPASSSRSALIVACS
jgi:hypothetical protein